MKSDFSVAIVKCKSGSSDFQDDIFGFNVTSARVNEIKEVREGSLGSIIRSSSLDSEYLVVLHSCSNMDTTLITSLIKELESDACDPVVVYPGIANEGRVLFPEQSSEISLSWLHSQSQGFSCKITDWPIQIWNLKRIRDTGVSPVLESGLSNEDLFKRISLFGFRAKFSASILARVAADCYQRLRQFKYTKGTNLALDRLPHYFADSRFVNIRPPKILIDASGLPPWHNGTSAYIMKALEFLVTSPEYSVEIYGVPSSFKFHRIWSIFGDKVITALPSNLTYDLCIKLDQPWSEEQIQQHSRCSLRTLYIIYDIIALDISAVNEREIFQTWKRVSLFSDLLIFISDYTKDLWLDRFPKPIRHVVTYPSLNPSEYRIENLQSEESSDKIILVIGNELPHKDIAWIKNQIALSYPTLHVTTFSGGRGQGMLSSAEVSAIYMRAKIIIFPSLYEGFGNPIVESLAFSRFVVARRTKHNEQMKKYLGSALQLYDSLSELFGIIDSIIMANELFPEYEFDKKHSWQSHFDVIKEEMSLLLNSKFEEIWYQRRQILNEK